MGVSDEAHTPGTVLAVCLDLSLARWCQLLHCAANRSFHNVLADIIAGKVARTKDSALRLDLIIPYKQPELWLHLQ